MVTVREQLPGRLNELSQETTVEHAEQAHQDLTEWLDRVRGILDGAPLTQLEEVAHLTLERELQSTVQHRSNTFYTGIEMADILAHLHVDEDTLSAAMLYRAVREGVMPLSEVLEQFGEQVHSLVKGTLAMGKLSELIEKNKRLEDHFNNNQREHLSGIYKMLISVTEDVRVVLVKLAERTYALRELANSSRERQERVAREILTIYSPLAHRLGIAQLKWELEDLAFRYLAPERYKEIASLLNEKRLEREQYIQFVIDKLRNELAEHGIEAEINGRVKHIYSIYRKMKSKNLSFDQLYDIRALRVLVKSVPECYHTLGIVHQIWRHIPHQFDDYITNPKANGYRSLHTAVIAENKSLEVQIRTHAMHDEAELGVCSHFNYKEGAKTTDRSFNHRLHSLRAVLEHYQERNESSAHKESEDEIENFEHIQDFEGFEKIYVFSRDGDIKELPRDSSVLDFAYHVHTEVGNKCYAARVNQRYVPLTYTLKTGEQVEILTKKDREPNRDWLVNSLGYIKTARARDKLRHWFRQQDRSKNLEVGREVLNKELSRLAIHPKSIDLNDYCSHFNVKTGDDILVNLVNGDISLHALINQVNRHMHLDQDEPELVLKPALNPRASHTLSAHGILIDGLDNVELHIAQCCQPVHGESIAGYITLNRGVSIHKVACPDYVRMISQEPERAVEADWEMQPTRGQSVQIVVEAYDRRGLLKDLTQVIFSDQINIRQVNTISEADGIANMKLLIEVKGLAQLSKLLARLEQQPGIISARRLVQGT
ncbi:bifunctional (p)ppGpp synthetase/guanosine-3',5'-bis(diphosphate) 3'-pyrophosphohydrolase [Acinetobacter lwoffii]|jgi:GTP pyrophosphokinase|uniref:GTP pyrophosphokinase n=1 Tax=Acinetobacter lwoffii TaxID=28090 RepID=A0AAJ4TU55_ACILW|nr:bifunctional (p)ppGpp synthetase/guanosine-3',5'-bis(diphosphate) 3'-pyrophosphohydrolase [Acinetobacter lwoffii]QGR74427.1 RelA/SpoT family protein [Acinetobacter lwoffii]QKT99348.1 bifunctional (p)ppGpp synthetase/guanosine-3',5'-bis(diphosphate) 3'-pyrophosphohydrolase [Acinetobacter lwoffii]QXR08036.1 bifunctional (p)ppGpp synthetase/guanosine-3',5'-bis(diphosphate) 3'-pyrophosphohydrolase [Acinetobacter lwoffii]TMS41872.1 bifunctional (p)ppGpp synthetase/guanosine-3',5'-bis(diphosphate)